MAKNFHDMSQEEQAEAYRTMMEKREAKKGTGKGKRVANKALIAAHEDQYKKILNAALKEVGPAEAVKMTDAELIAYARKALAKKADKKPAGKAKRVALKKLIESNQAEYDKILASAKAKAGK